MAERRMHPALQIFLAAFAVRLLVNLIFMSYFGMYAVNMVETWFYKGVMTGTHLPAEGYNDVTVWILRAIGSYLPEGMHLFAVEGFSVLLSSATAVLLFFLVRLCNDEMTGYAAGMAYAAMIQPVALCLTGFTHDHIQLPIILLMGIIVVKASRSSWKNALPLSMLLFLIFEAAKHINETAYIGLAICVGYATYSLLGYVFMYRRLKPFGEYIYPAFILIFLICVLISFFTFLPAVLEGMLLKLPQGRLGSADVMPISLFTLFLRYNLLLYLLPLGIIYMLRKRDVFGIFYLVIGFVLASAMDRGSRILDIGFAIMVGHFLVYYGRMKPFSMLEKRMNIPDFERALLIVSLFMVSFVFGGSALMIMADTRMTYALLFLFSIITTYYLLLSRDKRFYQGILAVMFILGMSLNVAYTFNLEARMISTRSEVDIIELIPKGGWGMVLAGWDRGFMIETITGKRAVSTPNRIRFDVHNYLWMPDEQANDMLRAENVSHIMITSENFNLIRTESEYIYRVVGGLLDPDAPAPNAAQSFRYTIYKLRHETENPYFRLVKKLTDPPTNLSILLYEVVDTGKVPANASIGAVVSNLGPEAVHRIMMPRWELVNNTFIRSYEMLSMVNFELQQTLELYYPLRTHPGECILRAEPLSGYTDSVGGRITLQNSADAGRYKVEIQLIDLVSQKPTGNFESFESFGEGEIRAIDYNFDGVDPYQSYRIGFRADPALKVIQERSTSPSAETVAFISTFC